MYLKIGNGTSPRFFEIQEQFTKKKKKKLKAPPRRTEIVERRVSEKMRRKKNGDDVKIEVVTKFGYSLTHTTIMPILVRTSQIHTLLVLIFNIQTN